MKRKKRIAEKIISIWINKNDLKELDRLANEWKVSRGYVIRAAIEKFLESVR